MNYLLAISGGVDSIVLLDVAAKVAKRRQHKITVAHVNHGIRSDSASDARFVKAMAALYQLDFVGTDLQLGKSASEDDARSARYKFFFEQAKKLSAQIVIAHHLDDLVGSVAINIYRGTGWRGVSVMNRPGIMRPLLHRRKSELIDYALRHRLEWVEDETNQSHEYLRNFLRPRIIRLPGSTFQSIEELRRHQLTLGKQIDSEVTKLVGWLGDSRYKLIQMPVRSGVEVLRCVIKHKTARSLTPEQLERGLLFIKTGKSGSKLELAETVRIQLTKRGFIVYTYPR